MLCSVMLPLCRQQVNVQSWPVPTPHSPPPMFGDWSSWPSCSLWVVHFDPLHLKPWSYRALKLSSCKYHRCTRCSHIFISKISVIAHNLFLFFLVFIWNTFQLVYKLYTMYTHLHILIVWISSMMRWRLAYAEYHISFLVLIIVGLCRVEDYSNYHLTDKGA